MTSNEIENAHIFVSRFLQMKMKHYLARKDVREFVIWLSERVTCAHGSNPSTIKFNNGRGKTYKYIHDGMREYDWPYRANNNIPMISNKLLPLRKKSGLYQNTQILVEISKGLTNAKTDTDFRNWAKATMLWGGVGRNNQWIDNNTTGILRRAREICDFVSSEDDDVDAWYTQSKHQNGTLRFNAGWTKVISLMCDDFVIYDSRVAAALAWLVHKWDAAQVVNKDHELSFGCLTPNEGKNAKIKKIRNPDKMRFKNITNRPLLHLKWNIRANWILSAALDAGNGPFNGVRELEAAQFTIGYDLGNS